MARASLATRLERLEAAILEPLERRRRAVAEGKCPDCGWKHGERPSDGGEWRCVLCRHPFVLEPGRPGCAQECPSCCALQR
jgi:hypothetical protein